VSQPSAFDVETAVKQLKTHKSADTDQISAELIKAEGGTICCEIRKCIVWNKDELPEQWKSQSFYQFILMIK
jgi:hypothetical protein